MVVALTQLPVPSPKGYTIRMSAKIERLEQRVKGLEALVV